MKPFKILVLFILMSQVGCAKKTNDPKLLIEQMVNAVGGREQLTALKDVELQYTFHDLTDGKRDVSIERYLFDGQLSWAKFTVREKYAFPDLEGEIIQGYNGKETWMTQNGQLITDPQALRLADFTRKTNFYWFMMMYKLLDPGVNYTYKGTKKVDGIDYDLVGIGFDPGVGDVQDTYVLYLNPKTHLVDQFLFTVMDFGIKEPFLMKVEYEEIAGLKLPTKRKAAAADWDGILKDENWVAEISENIKFNNGFTREMFEKPDAPAVTEKS